jgi:hypothetical protein
MENLLKNAALLVLTIALASCTAARAPIPLSPEPAISAPAPNTVLKTTGVLIPLYVYPGKIWEKAIAAKYAHARVPMVIVANVDNGPGANVDPTYLSYIKEAQKAGIFVLGYVYTSYSKRSQKTVDADMAEWYDRYHTDGVFLDEMAVNDPSYYQAATAYAHAHSLWFVAGNPGVSVPGNSGPDVINFYENHGYPSPALLKSAKLREYGKTRWSYIAGAVGWDRDRIILSTNYVGWLYVTDASEPECYCGLPSYFSRLLSVLDSH